MSTVHPNWVKLFRNYVNKHVDQQLHLQRWALFKEKSNLKKNLPASAYQRDAHWHWILSLPLALDSTATGSTSSHLNSPRTASQQLSPPILNLPPPLLPPSSQNLHPSWEHQQKLTPKHSTSITDKDHSPKRHHSYHHTTTTMTQTKIPALTNI